MFAAKLDAGGKPSTWFPPGRLVEHIYLNITYSLTIQILKEFKPIWVYFHHYKSISCLWKDIDWARIKYCRYSHFSIFMCLYVDLFLYPTASNRFPFNTRLRSSDAPYNFVWGIGRLSANECSNFTQSSFWSQNFQICHFSENWKPAVNRQPGFRRKDS